MEWRTPKKSEFVHTSKLVQESDDGLGVLLKVEKKVKMST